MKRNNHVVTRGYLAGWRSDERIPEGLWYFDIPTRSVKFEPGLKAEFAISRDLYAPIYIDGARDDRFENWLAESESALCDLSRVHTRVGIAKLKPSVIEKALASMISAGYRSNYSIRFIEKQASAGNTDLTDDEIRVKVLNAVYAGSQDRIAFFLRGSIAVLQNVHPPLMTNDQPFWDMTPLDETSPIGVFALSPTTLVLFGPANPAPRGRFQLAVMDAGKHQVLIEFARKAAMRMAREWIVCASEAEARQVAVYLTEETLREAWATDKPRILHIDGPRSLFPSGGFDHANVPPQS